MDTPVAPVVSVIIPTYNRCSLVVEAAKSVLEQTLREFELIVVDDGSTDGTVDAMKKLTRSDDRLVYLRIDHVGFPGAVRNRGVEASSAPFMAFLDSDDLWRPEKLARQTELHRESGAKLSHTREHWLRNGKTVSQSSQKHARSGYIFEDSLVKCIIGPSTVMVDRSLYTSVGGFREDLEIAEDYELWLRLTPRISVEYIDDPLTVKRAGHGNQLSLKYGHIEKFRIDALRALIDDGFFNRLDIAPDDAHSDGNREFSNGLARNELARKCRIYATGARKRGRDEEAIEYDRLADEYETVS